MLIDNGAEITGAISGAALGLVLAGPPGAIAGAALSPVVSTVLKKIGENVSNNILGPREKIKVGATYALALEEISTRLANGESPREDGFFEASGNDRSSAETILEGTLLKSRDEHEEKKLKFYSHFLANLTFDSDVTFYHANTLLKIAEQLSYRQLCIIALFKTKGQVEMKKWGKTFNQTDEVQKYRDFYYELMNLYDKQILKEYGGISMSTKNGELSLLGISLYNLMNLNQIEGADINEVDETMESIDEISNPEKDNNKS